MKQNQLSRQQWRYNYTQSALIALIVGVEMNAFVCSLLSVFRTCIDYRWSHRINIYSAAKVTPELFGVLFPSEGTRMKGALWAADRQWLAALLSFLFKRRFSGWSRFSWNYRAAFPVVLTLLTVSLPPSLSLSVCLLVMIRFAKRIVLLSRIFLEPVRKTALNDSFDSFRTRGDS